MRVQTSILINLSAPSALVSHETWLTLSVCKHACSLLTSFEVCCRRDCQALPSLRWGLDSPCDNWLDNWSWNQDWHRSVLVGSREEPIVGFDYVINDYLRTLTAWLTDQNWRSKVRIQDHNVVVCFPYGYNEVSLHWKGQWWWSLWHHQIQQKHLVIWLYDLGRGDWLKGTNNHEVVILALLPRSRNHGPTENMHCSLCRFSGRAVCLIWTPPVIWCVYFWKCRSLRCTENPINHLASLLKAGFFLV